MAHCDAREGKWRENWRMEWVASSLALYLKTWCIQHYYRWCAHLGCQQSTELTPPADLNGLVRLAKRLNLISARVPSHFSLPLLLEFWTLSIVYRSTSHKRQAMQCTYNVTLRRLRATVVVVKKRCVTYSKCMSVALVIQHAKRKRRIISPSVAGPAIRHFSTVCM